MTDPQIATTTDDAQAPDVAPEMLVPGVNPAFLRDRLVIPLAFNNGVTRWGLADPTDTDTLAALRFASRASITPVLLPESAILALLGDNPQAADRRIDADTPTLQIPHAEAVIRLRSYLVEAIAASADRIDIIVPAGTLCVRKAADDIASHKIGTLEAEALAAAASALGAKGDAFGRHPGISIGYRGARVWVTIEPSSTGVALLLAPIGSN